MFNSFYSIKPWFQQIPTGSAALFFTPGDKRREYAFLWNYSGMNIGFFIGVTCAGIFQASHKFDTLFFATSFSSIIAMTLTLFNWKKLKDVDTVLSTHIDTRLARGIFAIIAIAVIVILIQYILMYALFTTEIILVLGGVMSIVITILTMTRKDKREKNKLIAFCIFAVASLIFYTLYELIPMALTLFLERNVDRHIFQFLIPTPWFLNINTIIIIFGCPLLVGIVHKLRKKGRVINIPFFFSSGLLLIGLAIVILPIGIYFAPANGFISPVFPICTYILLALAEISLSPIGYSIIGELSPPTLRGVLMGTWLMISGVSAILSKIFSNLALGEQGITSPLVSNPSYSRIFFILGISGILFGLILWLMRHILHRLIISNNLLSG